MFPRYMRIMNCGSEHLAESRLAGARISGLLVLLIAALAAGCAQTASRARAVADPPAPQPPVFLTGPMALLLTNVDGFRARVVLESGAPARQVIAGELISQGGNLVFAPDLSQAADKHPPAEGFAFIWNVAANQGYLLNEPLQAYAPISSSRQFTNLAASTAVNPSAPQKVAGHPCQPIEVTVAATDGSTTLYRLWRATDLKGLPLRITCASNGLPQTLTLSKVRLQTLPNDLFLPPNGFTKYDSPEALATELAARQRSLKHRPSPQTEEIEPIGGTEGRAPTRPQ